MNLSRLSRMMVAVSVLTVTGATAPVTGVASAQTSATAPITCAIAQGPLTAQQESVVNDYEVQVARANARHTPVPVMPDEVFVLIGCISPASQTGAQTPASSPPSPTPATGAAQTAVSTPTPSTTSAPSGTFTCPPNGLSKAQLSQINDYEVLVAKANAKHTLVPEIPSDVAAFIACQ